MSLKHLLASVAFVGWTLINTVGSPVAGTAGQSSTGPKDTQSARRAFVPAAQGEFHFDTGVLRGKLRVGNKAAGLGEVVHVPSGLRLDRGYGLFSHYRVFSTGKRYGTAAWEWPGKGSLQADGAVEVYWPSEAERPFEMRAIYRWAGPATLDLETQVIPQQDLPGFEVFLASYFSDRFTNALVCVKARPADTDTPRFMAAERALGHWLMFPRDAAAQALIQDGRWLLPPHPVRWTIQPTLARPVAVRRDPHSQLTAILMAPPQDCFAIATPYQTEAHYSVYLSLGGQDLRNGVPVRFRSRLEIAVAPSEGQILGYHQQWLTSLGRTP